MGRGGNGSWLMSKMEPINDMAGARTCKILIMFCGNIFIWNLPKASKIQMKSYLSGMPECKFGINDKTVLDNKAPRNSSY